MSPPSEPIDPQRYRLRSVRPAISRDDRFDWKSVVKTASFFALHPKVSREWLAFMRTPARVKLWLHHPRLLDKVLRPYLNGRWGPQERANALIGHYSWLRRMFTRSAVHRLYLDAPVLLATCNTRSAIETVSLRLGYDGAFEREGDLTLGLYSQSAAETSSRTQPELIVAITMSVASIDGRPALCIGCVQTRRDARAQDVIRQITKNMHGLRPKSLLVEMAKLMARRWQLELLGIDPDAHPFTSLRYRLSLRKRQAVEMMRQAYIDLWQEQGGCQVSGGWYGIPVEESVRLISAVPSNKRSMYTKRFTMLDDIECQINASLSELESTNP